MQLLNIDMNLLVVWREPVARDDEFILRFLFGHFVKVEIRRFILTASQCQRDSQQQK